MHDNRAGSDIIDAEHRPRLPSAARPQHQWRGADIAAVIGAAFDDGRGHAQAYATYRQQNPVLQSSRDYSFCALSALPRSIRAPAMRPPGPRPGTTLRRYGRLYDRDGS